VLRGWAIVFSERWPVAGESDITDVTIEAILKDL
jgi:hypothetical protein